MESESLDTDNPDRPRGVLSKADREYLLATKDKRETEYTRQARSNRERAIRERLRHAVFDMDFILRALDQRVLEQVFEPEQITPGELVQIERGLAGTVGMIYYIADSITAPEDSDEFFEDLIERGVWDAKSLLDDPDVPAFLECNVYFEVSKPDVDIHTIGEKVRAGDLQTLSEPELRTFLWVYERLDTPLAGGEEAAKEFLDYATEHLPDNYSR